MAVTTYFVFALIISLCYEGSGSTTRVHSALGYHSRREARSLVRLECAVTGLNGSKLHINWYRWGVGGNDEYNGSRKQLLKSKQCTIGAEGTFISILLLPRAGLSGCYTCQAGPTKRQHSTSASDVLCFGTRYDAALHPRTPAFAVNGVHAVRLKRSAPQEDSGEVGPLLHTHTEGSPFRSSRKTDTLRGNSSAVTASDGTSGNQDKLTAIYTGVALCVFLATFILLLAILILGLCWRRHTRKKATPPRAPATITVTSGAFVESRSLSSTSPLRLSAFSRTHSDGDLAMRRIPRPSSDVDVRVQRHRRRSEADSRDEALMRSDRSRSPYRIPLIIKPSPQACVEVERVGECPFPRSIFPYCDDALGLSEEKSRNDACSGPRGMDDSFARPKPNICHRRTYSEVILLPRQVPLVELFDDPKYASVCIAPSAGSETSPLPPSQLNN